MAPMAPGAAPPWGRMLSRSEQLAIRIQERIRDEGLQPGDHLGIEQQVAREYGVSRPTLREALRILSSARIVRSVSGPKGGIFVERTPHDGLARSLSDTIALMLDLQGTSVEELLEARTMLEVPLARLAAVRAGSDTVAELRAALAVSEDADADQAALHAADERFHRAIAAASGNAIIESVTQWTFEVLQPRLRELLQPDLDESVILDQRREILRAIEARDPVAAEDAMRAHLGHLAALARLVKRRRRAPVA
jgi:GntR family transcriptional regulator, transcriptional repressor for pyruvate dehydrogenase complex